MVILYITLLCLEFLVSIISNPFLIPRWLSRLYHMSDYMQLLFLFIEMLCSLHSWAWVDGFVVAFSDFSAGDTVHMVLSLLITTSDTMLSAS